MTADRPPVARLCSACCARMIPIDQHRCDTCDPGRAPNATPTKRAIPKPLDLSQLPEPSRPRRDARPMTRT